MDPEGRGESKHTVKPYLFLYAARVMDGRLILAAGTARILSGSAQ